MDKINELVEKLDKKITKSLYRRLEARNKLLERLDLAKSEYDADPSDENSETLAQIQEYVDDVTDDLIEDLEIEIENREKAKEGNPAPSPEPTPASIEAKVVEEKEEKSGMSIFGIALGVVLLVGTAGAYNYFNKNR